MPRLTFALDSKLLRQLMDCLTEVHLFGTLVCTPDGIACMVTDNNVTQHVFACETHLGLAAFDVYEMERDESGRDVCHFIPFCFPLLYQLLKCDKNVHLQVDVDSTPTTLDHVVPWAAGDASARALLPPLVQSAGSYWLAQQVRLVKLDEKQGTATPAVLPINPIDRHKPPIVPKPVAFATRAYTHAVRLDISDLVRALTMLALTDLQRVRVCVSANQIAFHTHNRRYEGSEVIRGSEVRPVRLRDVLSTREAAAAEDAEPGSLERAWDNAEPLELTFSLSHLFVAVFFAWKVQRSTSIFLCVSRQCGMLLHFPLVGFGHVPKQGATHDRDVYLRHRIQLYRPNVY